MSADTIEPHLQIIEPYVRKARALRGDNAAAIAYLTQSIAEITDPAVGASLRIYAARALINAGRPAEAAPLCLAVLAAEPNDATALRVLRLAYTKAGETEKAEETLHKIQQLEPSQQGAVAPPVHKKPRRIELQGQRQDQAKRLNEAKKDFLSAVFEGQYGEAVENFFNPDHKLVYRQEMLLSMLYMIGTFPARPGTKKAAPIIQLTGALAARQTSRNAPLLCMLGYAYFYIGHREEAVDALGASLVIEPNNAEALQAVHFLCRRDVKKGRETAKLLLGLDPDNKYYRELYANSCMRAELYAEAEKLYESIHETPKITKLKMICAFMQNKNAEALALAGKVLDENYDIGAAAILLVLSTEMRGQAAQESSLQIAGERGFFFGGDGRAKKLAMQLRRNRQLAAWDMMDKTSIPSSPVYGQNDRVAVNKGTSFALW
jgi:tetratricopeptide (TPR) repeat protein